ncbi:MAG: histidinol-phosphatase HisJ family protein [Synergistaceae bacterium]|jgi:histidinol-phosphatase (PHP family)|nr:histidinol-phosphatase HisJ family protein [Synergistaceae bacterium]
MIAYENYYDSHVHSGNSGDATEPVDAVCAAAVKRGLKGIAFTDHCDIDGGRHRCDRVRRAIVRDVAEARELYGDDLLISAGIELGEPHHNYALAGDIAGDPGLDFVIGSLHRLRDTDDFYYIDYENVDLDSLMQRYYEELYELVESGCFDVVGHINYQMRYMSAAARKTVDLSVYYGDLFEILKSAARQGKGIEINTSGLQRGLGEIIPSPEVIGLFRRAGGEIVTIGSDAHNSRNVGAEIETAMDCLKSAGFGQFAFFTGREARMMDII